MPRFSLLWHECPPHYGKPSHWDFMLERDGTLWTWELHQLPKQWHLKTGREGTAEGPVPAKRLANHRIAYLEYEGPLSGNRGMVSRVAEGSFDAIEFGPELVSILVNSEMYRGHIQLSATREPDRWILELRD